MMKVMNKICNFFHGLKPALLMVAVQVGFAGFNVLTKVAASDGMSISVLVAYRFIFATLFIFPLALILERKSRPKLTWTILFQGFLSGLLGGSLFHNFYLKSLALTSATFASAIFNLVPAVTFVLAIIFRLEKLGITTLAGKAKVVGTVAGITGAMLLTFYKGEEINIWSTHADLLKNDQPHVGHVTSAHSSHVLGSLLAVGSCFSYALWLILQARMSVKYPCPYSSTALMSMMGSIQSVIFALCIEKDWSQWKLGWNVRLLTVVYGGVVVSGLMICLVSWCVRMKGPLFVSVFNPLLLVLVALAGSIFLDEKLHVGSLTFVFANRTILGAMLIVCGLYAVLWGKRKEMKKMSQLVPSTSSGEAESIQIIVTTPKDNSSNITVKGNNNSNMANEDLLEKEQEKEEK